MSVFDPAFKRTMAFEGVTLEEVPGDSGGLTFCGISRNNFPGWSGWPIIDQYLDSNPFPTARQKAVNDPGLMALVEQFYQTSIWNQNKLALVDTQEMADQLFDAVINLGQRAIKGIQGLVNVTQDGIMGLISLNAINAFPDQYGLINSFLEWRRNTYQQIVAKRPQDQKFLEGWLNRCVREEPSGSA